ncbi:DUF547 domain-containing protein [Coraliomargarita algicola]|uniref:DUF547 domain-containing protein n=1 Tax=Coraliomargarita algicola TaxID=3092156 RepID=A0ABZ0RLD6_9BACT|nr:DUF547 domain-containing protein [Coraliomargarita sp. J2-16]WPJ95815.1 DUF547 domain-containing protein [Coraliomargarita sp. J2-16]
MKYFSLLWGFCLVLNIAESKVGDSVYAVLLQKYVQADGVSYQAWADNAKDVKALDLVLSNWSQVNVAQLAPEEQKAFYINLYNAAMLQAVLQRYPIDSVKDIGLIPFSIFRKNYIKQGDRNLSLDDIEKGILLQQFPDPRIHFAVNCASVSCPPLRQEPYRAELLNAQLEEQARLFAASDRAARVDSRKQRTAYSELFNWYASDFGVDNPALFLNRYRSDALPPQYEVTWIDYDWSLNSAE